MFAVIAFCRNAYQNLTSFFPIPWVGHRLVYSIGAESAGCGGVPDHVELDGQRILDAGNLLAGVRVKSGMSPRFHPLDQFRFRIPWSVHLTSQT
jgi:hypothetical protein